ncbi:MAG TPA: tRNA threonylcarbamoyladenosine dehydratase [Rhodocyclaceae bacterium]|nr:tRNA threonylcarbamoyladenosine dehydratase [Rhodocyclaceae bacterium]
MEQDNQDSRRFGGIERLYGPGALSRFNSAHVMVIGLGGVGSWAAEALARSGIGALTLVDFDHVSESNTNRQIHALEGEYGRAKVAAMQERVLAIQPDCTVTCIDEFAKADNLPSILASPPDFVVDAIDSVRDKTALLAYCHAHEIAMITTGAAGGKRDPTRLRIADLAMTEHDPLLARVRANLRKLHGFPRERGVPFGIQAVYSVEPVRTPDQVADCVVRDLPTVRWLAGLSCAGYGSSVAVTASFGLWAAARALEAILAADHHTASRHLESVCTRTALVEPA